MNNNEVMKLAIEEARKTMNNNIGGPFGAAIVKDGKVICVSSNTVLKDHDATAHAEINAIRKASTILQTHDLTGCTLYSTGYPCPMCLSAIIWANISKVYYGNSREDAKNIGFRDDAIYEFIENKNDNKMLDLECIDRDETIKTFENFLNKSDKTIY
jgi:tRNA(Arg) A34 adenosine deaminase TadA